MTRYLGIDYGTKRVGVAVGDDGANIAAPVKMVPVQGNPAELFTALIALANDYEADAFVVGLPINMDDTEGKQAKLTRTFGDSLAKQADRPVHYFDERLSTATAEELLIEADLTRKKKRGVKDSVAATVILQGFLDEIRERASEP